MDVLSLALIVILLALPLILLKQYGKSKEFKEVFNKIPGPKGVPILGNALDTVGLKPEDVVNYNKQLHEKHGPVVKLWIFNIPNVSLCSAEAFEVILSGMKHIEKSFLYDLLHEWLGQGLLTSKGQKWQKHRKMITPTFHFKILEHFVEIMEEKSDIFVKCLKSASANGKEFDIYPYIVNLTLDIICETAMGMNMNSQLNPQGGYVSAVKELSELTTQRISNPLLLSDSLYKFTPMGKKWKQALNILHGFTIKVLEEKREERNNSGQITPIIEELEFDIGKKKRVAFLELLLDSARKDPTITDTDIRDEVDTFMFEGHDTTTNGIAWTIFLLGHHPEIQEIAYQEIKEIYNGEDRPITNNDLTKMKYLERVLKESLRLYPPVPIIGRKIDEDIKVNGIEIPAGTYATVLPYVLHRMPKYFPNPLVFNPDNFLPENIKDRHPYAYVPFSAGPRNCIGQKFAVNEEKIVLSSILKNFKITSLDKVEDVKMIAELVLRPKDGIRVKLEQRK